MRLWITGCAGFLGCKLAERFSSLGHTVVGLSRRKCPFAHQSVQIDLASDEAGRRLQKLREDLGPPDVVMHAAAKQPGPAALSEFIKSNVLTTANLLAALREFPPRQIFYTSTLGVYGCPVENPVPETYRARGTLPYSATKRWGEQICEPLAERAQVAILRLPSLYGAGQADSFIDGLARLAMRDEPIELFSRGELVRDALHVADVVKAIEGCIVRPPDASFCLLNLGCGRPIKTLEYAQALVEALGSKSEILPVDWPAAQPDLYADIEQARLRIGFEPTPLKQSMERYRDELRA